jgi:hypothetical protein
MKKYVIFIFALIFIFSFLKGETKMVDVTGDGVDDEIKIGEQSVVVINGATGKRYTVISGEEFLSSVNVNNYHSGIKGKEIAVVICPGADYWTEIYGFINNQFKKVSEMLPGQVVISADGSLVGFRRHLWEGGEAYVPCPIREEKKLLKALPIKKEIAKTIVIDAGKTKDITYTISGKTLVVCFATVKEKDVIISLRDKGGSLVASQKINPTTAFIGGGYTPADEEVTLTIDNSYSVITPKVVYYVIDQYEYKPSKEELDAAIRSNMHIVQLSVEDYATRNEGVFPQVVSDFLHLLPSSFINPVDPDILPVVDGTKGKPGQVCYIYDSKTEKYKIYGFDADGKQLALVLSY